MDAAHAGHTHQRWALGAANGCQSIAALPEREGEGVELCRLLVRTQAHLAGQALVASACTTRYCVPLLWWSWRVAASAVCALQTWRCLTTTLTAPSATDVTTIVVAPRASNVPAAEPNAVTSVRVIGLACAMLQGYEDVWGGIYMHGDGNDIWNGAMIECCRWRRSLEHNGVSTRITQPVRTLVLRCTQRVAALHWRSSTKLITPPSIR